MDSCPLLSLAPTPVEVELGCDNMKTALTILKSALPKTLILFTAPYDPTKIADITNKHFGCQFMFPTMCPCLSESSRPGLVELRTQYEEKLVELAAEMRYGHSKRFCKNKCMQPY